MDLPLMLGLLVAMIALLGGGMLFIRQGARRGDVIQTGSVQPGVVDERKRARSVDRLA